MKKKIKAEYLFIIYGRIHEIKNKNMLKKSKNID